MKHALAPFLVLCALCASPGPVTAAEAANARSKPTWTPSIDDALELAGAESRVVMLALGEVGEGRSERHAKSLYGSKAAAPFVERTVNVAAWSCDDDETKKLPRFKDVTPEHHVRNLASISERWLTPNDEGVVALPHHLWLSPKGEVLVSVPWELDAAEFAWCAHEALRLAGATDLPELPEDARPPRRLLLGATYRVIDEDVYGRGLEPDELDSVIGELNKRFLTLSDQREVIRILFTDDDDAVDYIQNQVGQWDRGGAARLLVDGTIGLVGVVSPARFVEILDKQATSERDERRARVAAAYEDIGSSEGLAAVKKAWKKEKVDSVRAEWVRALGACGKDDKSTVRTLVRAVEKEKSGRVRISAILALGHALPREDARTFLEETVASGRAEQRDAAILALALGRSNVSRALVAKVKEGDVEPETVGVVDAALAVLDGGNLYAIEDEIARVSESEIARGRLFFRPVGAALERLARRQND